MKYRIVEKNGRFEPQMEYTAGMTGKPLWTPLGADGYWINPESYSFGTVVKSSLMSEQEAVRAVALAKRLNGEPLLTDTGSEPTTGTAI